MPSISFRQASTTTDAMSNRKFNVIGGRGAIHNMWCSGATAGDSIGLSVGDRDILVQGSHMNVESATNVVDMQRDQLVINEPTGPGQIFMPISLTTAVNVRLHIIYMV